MAQRAEDLAIVACYLASDVHLRLDRPERGARFTRWVERIGSDDSLFIIGDLCDFWMGSRLRERDLLSCDGLQALVRFRERGGSLSVMPGNHDLWLCPFYERELGATILPDPFDTTLHGMHLHVVHGHLLGARKRWKALMESREFWKAFGLLPSPVAAALDQILERKNKIALTEDERRHLAVYRTYAASHQGQADLVVIGHVHRAVYDQESDPRMIVLGGWQYRSSYLRIDDTGASFLIVDDSEPESGIQLGIPRATASTESSVPPS
jgi:UDP-2,3-diacylglucosamine hydrolase